jgi:hemerythrin superfamily protein
VADTTIQLDNAEDVVDFLKAQHERIKSLFADVLDSQGKQREDLFVQLRRLLAVHETAEEEIVHPRARHLADVEQIVARRLEEEHKAKETLRDLEKLDVDSAEFDQKFRALQEDVLAHAEAEERQEFTALSEAFDAPELERMRNAVQFAERMAPTRPHPGVESAAANMMAGPFAMMIDRARDAIRGKG